MLKQVAVALLLVALLTVGTAFSGSQSEEAITPEEFAAFFQICCRPPAITEDHLPYIRNLHGFGADSQTYDLLASNLPIDGAKLDHLCTEHPRKFTEGKCFLLRTLFDLASISTVLSSANIGRRFQYNGSGEAQYELSVS